MTYNLGGRRCGGRDDNVGDGGGGGGIAAAAAAAIAITIAADVATAVATAVAIAVVSGYHSTHLIPLLRDLLLALSDFQPTASAFFTYLLQLFLTLTLMAAVSLVVVLTSFSPSFAVAAALAYGPD
ncbi:P-loop containing nucleoside triphosphate hydrolase protein [Apiospora sp. TS-2023a]